jgi:uncharacterized phiE125 gp8 family phage protein
MSYFGAWYGYYPGFPGPWHRRQHERLAGLTPIDTAPGPIIAIETLRAQCSLVPIDADTDAASGESHPDDPLLLAFLDAAIDYAEDFTGLSIAQRTYEMAMDTLPCGPSWLSSGIAIPRAPLIRVLSFTAVGGGSDGELDEGDDYTVHSNVSPPLLRPVGSWPHIVPAPDAVRIRFLSGYRNGVNDDSDFTDAPMLPGAIRHSLLLLVAHFYENRESSLEKALTVIPFGVDALLGLKRQRLGMA